MKTILSIGFSRIFTVLFLMGTLFTACSEDNEGHGEENTPTTLAVTYSFKLTQDYLKLVDATVTYWNEKGEQKTDPLTATSWEKKLVLNASQEFGFKVNATPKANIDELLTATSYVMGYEYSCNYWSSKGNGKSVSFTVSDATSKDKVKAYIEKYPEIYKFNMKWNKDTDAFAN